MKPILLTFLLLLTLQSGWAQCVELYPPSTYTTVRYPNGDFRASGGPLPYNGLTGTYNFYSGDIGNHSDWTNKSDHMDFLIKTDGTLWGMGFNTYGQLGNCSTNPVYVEHVLINSDTDWKYISPSAHCLALKNNGTLWSWGLNDYGQLGNGNNTNSCAITQVGTDSDWVKVYTFERESFAIKSNGTLWMWGYLSYGHAGDGTIPATNVTNQRTTPQQIGTDTDWADVKANYDGVIALKTNGTIWTWGKGIQGTLGSSTRTTIDKFIPMQMGTENDWSLISVSTGCLALKNNGTIWAWGFNFCFALGISTSQIYYYTPLQIGSDNDWIFIRTSYNDRPYHPLYTNSSYGVNSIAQKLNENFYGWGYNRDGIIGILPYEQYFYTPTLKTFPNCALSTTSQTFLQDVIIAPNPTKDLIKINYNLKEKSELTFVLSNNIGQQLYSFIINNEFGANQETIDLSKYPVGIYFLNINTDGTQKTIKVLKN